MHVRTLGAIALCAVGLGCGGESRTAGDWTGSITDSAGVQIVQNPSTGFWSEGTQWTVREVLRIGSSTGDPDYQFGQIAGITVGTRGEIFVLDQQAAQLRVFDADGVYQRSIGKPGNGPGELGRGAAGLLHLRADTLLVPDMTNMRVQFFLEDGTPAGNYRIDMAAGMPMRWQDTPSGDAIVQIRSGMFDTEQKAEQMDAIVLQATNGTVRDTILQVPGGKSFSMAGGAPEFNFFSPEPMWTFAPDVGIWYGVNNKYEIGLYNEAGELQRKLRKSHVSSPVTEEDQTIMVDMMKRIFEQQAGVPPQLIEQLLSRIEFADNFPAYLQFLTGPESSLWVQHIQVPSELTADEKENFNPLLNMGAPVWDVFDAEGRFMGEISMPSRFQPIRFANDRIYGVWRDELDVQYVMALQVGGGDTQATLDIGEQ